jgi:hypothetical protein
MTGIYQHCSEKHLHRNLAEFCYSNRVALGPEASSRCSRFELAVLERYLI